MTWYKPSDVGFAVRSKLADMGFGARLFLRLLASIGATLRRPTLLRDQIRELKRAGDGGAPSNEAQTPVSYRKTGKSRSARRKASPF